MSIHILKATLQVKKYFITIKFEKVVKIYHRIKLCHIKKVLIFCCKVDH